MSPRLSCFAFTILFVAHARLLNAHDPGLSTLRVETRPTDVLMVMSLAPADAAFLLTPESRNLEFSSTQADLVRQVPGFFYLELDRQPLAPPVDGTVNLLPGDNVEFHFSFKRAAGTQLVIKPQLLGALPPGHRQYATVVTADGVLLAEKLLNLRDATITLTLPKPAAASADAAARTATPPQISPTADTPAPTHARSSFHAFLVLGIEHILTGYDHLLFLFGLLVVCTQKKSILLIISSFTLGHSITLILATLDWATISPRVIEPAIAASIVFVGVENLVTRGAEPRGRWALTFFFGLIHGFGFAGVLRELGVGQMSAGLLVPLFSFNLGVEIGQLCVAAITLPLLAWARRAPAFTRRGVPILSALVGLAGLYWFLERTVLS